MVSRWNQNQSQPQRNSIWLAAVYHLGHFMTSVFCVFLQKQQFSHALTSVDIKSVWLWSVVPLLFSLSSSLTFFLLLLFLLCHLGLSLVFFSSFLFASSLFSNVLLPFYLLTVTPLFASPLFSLLSSAGFWQSLWARWETCKWIRQNWAACEPLSSSTQVHSQPESGKYQT